MPNLKDSTVLVRLGITSWPGKRHDPKIDEQVRIANSAHGDIGRFNKVLLAPQRLKEIAAVVNAFRSIHYHLTAPWLDEGLRILPAKLYTEHQTEERKFRQDFENKVAAFIADYPQLKADAKIAMNGLFNESDYPDIGTVAAKKYDIECWSPREGKYFETHSLSNCTSYQSVGLNIKYLKKGNEREFVHTLNATEVAVPRMLRAIIENHQTKEGTVLIPKALWPYMNGKKEIKP